MFEFSCLHFPNKEQIHFHAQSTAGYLEDKQEKNGTDLSYTELEHQVAINKNYVSLKELNARQTLIRMD